MNSFVLVEHSYPHVHHGSENVFGLGVFEIVGQTCDWRHEPHHGLDLSVDFYHFPAHLNLFLSLDGVPLQC